VKFVAIRAGKFQRRFEFSTITLLLRTFLGIIDAYKYVKEFKPDLIFCTGGYLGVPIGISAWLQGIPLYLHEQTAAVGLSNKLTSYFAKRVYITFPSSKQYFNPRKVLHTGNILRSSIFDPKKIDTKSDLYKAVEDMKKRQKDLPILYISGGGQGSHILNTIVRELMKYALLDYQIILQTGDNQVFKDFDVLTTDWKKLSPDLRKRMYVTKFVSDNEIGYVFKTMDLFVGRSGANTVYELGVLGKQSVLVPIPWVTHNEQELNARILEELGLSKIILEGEITPDKLNQTILKSLRNHTQQVNEEKRKEIFTLNAPELILKDIFK
ncbi:MAG TPA: glycosyltransferase, partial [Candidatus Dojkabacteria bacterium]|nr:glycosyltransferase [Candidatus Dojkabacteria bacterium]